MTRRTFVSYQHADQLTAKGFDLSRYDEHLDLCFLGRHILDPHDPVHDDRAHVDRKLREQITRSSLTIVIFSGKTVEDTWVAREIQWSLEKNPPNGLLGIQVAPTANIPEDLCRYGAEILEWYQPEDVEMLQGAIERAAAAARRARRIRRVPANSKSTCARTPISRPPSVAIQPGPPASTPAGPRREQLSNAETEAIQFAVDAAIDGWQQAVADRLADALAEELWTAFNHRWCTANCQALAQIARTLLEIKEEAHEVVGELTDWLIKKFERSTLEREVACALVKKIPLPTDALVETARALRIIGVYICMQFGDLGSCQCLKDLARDLFKDLSEQVVLQELESIARKAETSVRPQLSREELEAIVRNVLIETRPQTDTSGR